MVSPGFTNCVVESGGDQEAQLHASIVGSDLIDLDSECGVEIVGPKFVALIEDYDCGVYIGDLNGWG